MTRRERQVQYVWFIYLDKWNHCQLIPAKRFRCLLLGSKCNLYQIWFCQNFFFFFFLHAPVAHGNSFKGWTCSLFAEKWPTTAIFSKRATSHSLSSQLTPLEKAKGKDDKIFVVLKLKVKVITCGIKDSNYFQKLHMCFHFCFTQQKIRSLSLCQRLLIH